MADLIFRLTEKQKIILDLYERSDVLFISGPQGTAKTFTAALCAITDIQAKKKRRNIVVTRPIVEAVGEKLGFLPGDVDDKISSYVYPVVNNIKKILEIKGIQEKEFLKCVDCVPISHMKGNTYERSIIIADEAQNIDKPKMELLIGRLGIDSKLIMCGDFRQADISNSVFGKTQDLIADVEGVGIFAFNKNDNMRHPIIPDIMDRIMDVEY